MKHKNDRRPQRSSAPAQGGPPRASLRQGPERRWDERPQRTPTHELLYGRNAIREALRARRRNLRRLLIATGVREGGPVAELTELAHVAEVPVVEVERRALDELTEGANHQGVALEAGLYRYAQLDDMLALAQSRGELPLLLLLDHVQDPQNVGTLLRTADVVGAHGVVLPDRRAAGVTPAVVNASAGAVEHLLIAQVTNLVQAIEELKEHNVWIAGLEDDPRAQLFDQQRSDLPLALVVGAEGPGLSRLVRDRCDFLLKLPMAGHVASLNAATAGSIALYSLWRRRAQGKA
ncbi:MAG: 23S rRNA (guanosine(2251)-2'-O)-methyltransferase RlmB [Chloroflexota bacterium]|nr:23S rRNA (guanosine(2251)-2'-O)-methyltransferase RlmB [Chloroflexota bacterium]PLS79418.1 MAG: 23S rRNA (guanosine(2251)-2'-O)-methyltransferase RlmB [Chloroflexota bacterium]